MCNCKRVNVKIHNCRCLIILMLLKFLNLLLKNFLPFILHSSIFRIILFLNRLIFLLSIRTLRWLLKKIGSTVNVSETFWHIYGHNKTHAVWLLKWFILKELLIHFFKESYLDVWSLLSHGGNGFSSPRSGVLKFSWNASIDNIFWIIFYFYKNCKCCPITLFLNKNIRQLHFANKN